MLTTTSAGQVTYAQTINQLIQELQPAAGGQEQGNFYIAGNTYTTNTTYMSDCVITLSRKPTPVSISITYGAQTNLFPPLTGHLVAGSVQIYAHNKGQYASCFVGGTYTIFF